MAGKSILVVEDEPLVGMELQEGLNRLGYHVPQVVTNGDEVQTAMNRFHPDLILMDIHLQGSLDGIQATAKLRETSDVPVLFLTAYSDSATLGRAAEILPDGYLLKPFEERELAANIEMLLLKSQSRMKEKKNLRKMVPLLDALETALVIFDDQGRWIHGNPEALRVFGIEGYGPSQGQDLPTLLHISPEEFEADAEHWIVQEFPSFVDGSGKTKTLTIEALRGPKNRITGFLAIINPTGQKERDRLSISALTVNETIVKLLPENGLYRDRLENAGFLLPSPSGTGNMYDLFPLGPHHFAFYHLEVTGHGPLPAMIAYSLHSVIRDLARNFLRRQGSVPSPSSLVEALNRKFLPRAGDVLFFTLTFGILVPSTGEFQLVRAGHTRTLWTKADGTFEWLQGGGTALGAFPEVTFEELSGRLRSNDRLILCSDGVLETLGKKNLERGYGALENLIRTNFQQDLTTLALSIQAACLSAETSRRDDLSLLAIGSKLW